MTNSWGHLLSKTSIEHRSFQWKWKTAKLHLLYVLQTNTIWSKNWWRGKHLVVHYNCVSVFMSANWSCKGLAQVSDLEFCLGWPLHCTFPCWTSFFPSSEYNGTQHNAQSFCGKAVDGKGDQQQAEGKKQQPNYCWTLLLACSLCPLQQWYNRKNKAVHFIEIEIWQGGKWLSHTLPAGLHSEGFWWQWLSNVAQKLIKSIQSEFLCSSPNCLVSLSQGLMAKLFITVFTA